MGRPLGWAGFKHPSFGTNGIHTHAKDFSVTLVAFPAWVLGLEARPYLEMGWKRSRKRAFLSPIASTSFFLLDMNQGCSAISQAASKSTL